MKVLFLCGSLEFGKDGVGDYTRCLAGELTMQGHEVQTVSIYDQFISAPCTEFFGPGDQIPAFRLPRNLNDDELFRSCKDLIQKFRPDVISLQFVPYSFHLKGLPLFFVRSLSRILKGQRVHIMFHELWLDDTGSFAQAIVKKLQKYIIRLLILKLRPVLVNVSIPFNHQRLQDIGVNSSLLNIYGNIPMRKTDAVLLGFDRVEALPVKILYFGGSPRGSFLSLVLNELEVFCKARIHEVAVIVAGGTAAGKREFVNQLRNRLEKYGAKIIAYDFLSPDSLSFLFSHCTIGIGRSEPYLLGKSGAAIAMLEHGLPVWLPKWSGAPHELTFEFRRHLVFNRLEDATSFKDRPSYYPMLPLVAQEFVLQFNSHE
ncbi:hypothetical protein [Arcticibacter sp. MXS-1]|uniref:hypothetical protein n=1 Tax=Arcticibacter sp. MXS-1 TaxID=3341726 RepID=UPI0035A9A3AE